MKDISESVINNCRLTGMTVKDCSLENTNPTDCSDDGWKTIESGESESFSMKM